MVLLTGSHRPAPCACSPDTEPLYDPRYDAYFCKPCDVWLDTACDDPGCSFCRDRPEHPSEEPEISLVEGAAEKLERFFSPA